MTGCGCPSARMPHPHSTLPLPRFSHRTPHIPRPYSSTPPIERPTRASRSLLRPCPCSLWCTVLNGISRSSFLCLASAMVGRAELQVAAPLRPRVSLHLLATSGVWTLAAVAGWLGQPSSSRAGSGRCVWLGSQERGLSLVRRLGVDTTGRWQAVPPSSATGWPKPAVPLLCSASYGRRVKNAYCKRIFEVF
jgi:hypothetical protein